VIDDLDRILRV